jgi:hypothetical protein
MSAEDEEPLLYSEWLSALSSVYFDELDGTPSFEPLRGSLLVVKTVYHRIKAQLCGSASSRLAGQKIIVDSLESMANGRRGKWGEVNRLRFADLYEGLLPPLQGIPSGLPRDGSSETIDDSEGETGPGFRLLLGLRENTPIQGVNVMAGANATPGTEGWWEELRLWLSGQYRELVPFLH